MGILDNLKTNGFAMDYLNIWVFQEKYDITREKVFFSALNRISELGLTSLVRSSPRIVIKTTVFYI